MHFPSRIMKRMFMVPEKMKKKNCYKVTDFFFIGNVFGKKGFKKVLHHINLSEWRIQT